MQFLAQVVGGTSSSLATDWRSFPRKWKQVQLGLEAEIAIGACKEGCGPCESSWTGGGIVCLGRINSMLLGRAGLGRVYLGASGQYKRTHIAGSS